MSPTPKIGMNTQIMGRAAHLPCDGTSLTARLVALQLLGNDNNVEQQNKTL